MQKYNKPALTFAEQVDLVLSRGLLVYDRAKAEQTFDQINYYRLSAYFLPFQSLPNQFNAGTTFEDVLNLYEFDRELRITFLDALERIEVAFRTHLTYYLAHQKDFGKWGYLDSNYFEKHFDHSQWLGKVQEDIRYSKEIFVQHFFEKYGKQHSDLPLWMMTEVISFGRLAGFYRHLRKDYRLAIAENFYGVSSHVLSSWLQSLTFIRNLCAHHSRLWNRDLPVAPKIPRGEKHWESSGKRIFNIMMVFRNMLPKSQWDILAIKLKTLLLKDPIRDFKLMGFSDKWQESRLWQ